jgi:cell division protein FtsB
MGIRLGLGKIGALPSPEDGLRRVVERVPEAMAALERLLLPVRPTLTTAFRLRRRIATGGVLLLTTWLFFHVMFGANGWVAYEQKRNEMRELQQQVEALQQESRSHEDQIKALKTDRQAIEREAREQLHYARPGEVVYVSPPPLNPSKPANNTARK